MNITFFIGNGFDLNLGLNTRYSDFYPFFISKASEKNMIKGWISEDKTKWSDMELALGREMERIQSDDSNEFLRDKGELDSLLCQYLKQEENRIQEDTIESLKTEFIRSLIEFDKHLPKANQGDIHRIKSFYKDREFRYRFVTFNYTSILDRIVRCSRRAKRIAEHRTSNGTMVGEYVGDIMHVHGTTDEAMILGVDNIEQIGNQKMRYDDVLQQSFIKPIMSQGNGRNAINEVMNILEDTHILCIYGMSLGDTDAFWWNKVVNWLCNENNRLIIFAHDNNSTTIRQSGSMSRMKTMSVQDDLLSRENLSHDALYLLKSRIFVVFEPSIFCFDRDILVS